MTKEKDQSGEDIGAHSLLVSFSKPQTLTEKEVTFHKEQKICLVCKNKELRYTYICPECDALYCEKCARTLADRENACWFCDAPFDESKPVKLSKETEEKIITEEPLSKKTQK